MITLVLVWTPIHLPSHTGCQARAARPHAIGWIVATVTGAVGVGGSGDGAVWLRYPLLQTKARLRASSSSRCWPAGLGEAAVAFRVLMLSFPPELACGSVLQTGGGHLATLCYGYGGTSTIDIIWNWICNKQKTENIPVIVMIYQYDASMSKWEMQVIYKVTFEHIVMML